MERDNVIDLVASHGDNLNTVFNQLLSKYNISLLLVLVSIKYLIMLLSYE